MIGSSAALNQTTNCAKKVNTKKKTGNKPKSSNETTSTNLARLILNNLNIFGKFDEVKFLPGHWYTNTMVNFDLYFGATASCMETFNLMKQM